MQFAKRSSSSCKKRHKCQNFHQQQATNMNQHLKPVKKAEEQIGNLHVPEVQVKAAISLLKKDYASGTGRLTVKTLQRGGETTVKAMQELMEMMMMTMMMEGVVVVMMTIYTNINLENSDWENSLTNGKVIVQLSTTDTLKHNWSTNCNYSIINKSLTTVFIIQLLEHPPLTLIIIITNLQKSMLYHIYITLHYIILYVFIMLYTVA